MAGKSTTYVWDEWESDEDDDTSNLEGIKGNAAVSKYLSFRSICVYSINLRSIGRIIYILTVYGVFSCGAIMEYLTYDGILFGKKNNIEYSGMAE